MTILAGDTPGAPDLTFSEPKSMRWPPDLANLDLSSLTSRMMGVFRPRHGTFEDSIARSVRSNKTSVDGRTGFEVANPGPYTGHEANWRIREFALEQGNAIRVRPGEIWTASNYDLSPDEQDWWHVQIITKVRVGAADVILAMLVPGRQRRFDTPFVSVISFTDSGLQIEDGTIQLAGFMLVSPTRRKPVVGGDEASFRRHPGEWS